MEETFNHIDDLIGKYLAGEASAEERAEVDAWRKRQAENESYFHHLQLIFDRAGKIKTTQRFDADKAWNKVKDQLPGKGKQVFVLWRTNVLRAAAVLAFGIGLGYFVYQEMNPAAAPVVIAASNAVLTDTLPDGSLAVLNKKSTLTYEHNKRTGERRVALEGEAFFEVKHAAEEPFIIASGEVIIEDIGTTFNVRAFPDSPTVEVIVETGEVAFYTLTDKGLNLTAGETGVYDRQTKSFARLQSMDTNRLAYKTGIFSFRNADLGSIVDDLNAVYDKQIILASDKIRSCQLNVTFRNERIEDIVEIIAETLQLTISREGENYVLSGEGCADQ